MSSESPQVDIWQLNLDDEEHNPQELIHLLSAHQQNKANRLTNEQAKRRYIITQAQLRKLLAQYLSLSEKDVQLEYGEHGKPYIKDYPIHFNITHAHQIALIAICKTHELGIDIEFQRKNLHFKEIINRHFHPDEIKQFSSLHESQQTQSFYHAWTCKEAYVKAIGMGMQEKFNRFCVNMNPEQPPKLFRSTIAIRSNRQWILHKLNTPEHYFATLAITNNNPNLSYHHIG